MSYDTAQSNASSVRPLLEGDLVHGSQVRGFGWKPPAPGQRSGHHDDRLLLAGDEDLSEPPDRPVPLSSDGAVPSAPLPPADLRKDQVWQAVELDPALPDRVDALLDLSSAQWRPVIRPLLAGVHATGHRVWLAGGAVRDIVTGVSPTVIKDLDLAGTVPTGRFEDIAYQALRAAGKAHYPMKVWKDSLVCGIATATTSWIIEYRGLSAGGFKYPAVGSRLAEDALHRDFSFNTLIYDALDHQLFDPTDGLCDLLGGVRRFRPLKQTDRPLDLALVVLRAMKFWLRWTGIVALDLEPFHRWVETLPAYVWRMLTFKDWSTLHDERERLRTRDDEQRAFAAKIPEPARALLLTLIAGV